MNEICLIITLNAIYSRKKVLCSSRDKQQTRINSREDLTSVIVTLILLPTHCAKRNGRWDVLQRERKQKKQHERFKFGSRAQKRSARGQCDSLGFLVATTESVVRYRHRLCGGNDARARRLCCLGTNNCEERIWTNKTTSFLRVSYF